MCENYLGVIQETFAAENKEKYDEAGLSEEEQRRREKSSHFRFGFNNDDMSTIMST